MKRKIRRIKRKVKKSNIILILILLTILTLIIVFTIIGEKIINEKKEYEELINESKILNKNLSIETYNIENIKKLKNKKTCKNKNNILLEIAIEEYANDYSDILDKTIKSIKDERYANLLIISNYQADSPEFLNSINYLNDKNAEIDSFNEQINNIIKEENYMKYITKKTNDNNTIERYKLLIKNINNKNDINMINKDISNLKEILKISSDIFIYLRTNSNTWHIENNEIVFTNQEVKTEYDKAINKIKVVK